MTTNVIAREGGAGPTRTRFASVQRPDGDALPLEQHDEVADHLDIDRYFDGGVDNVIAAPWVDAGLFPTGWEGHWRAMPVVDTEVSGLRRTQKRLFKKHLVRAAAGGEPVGGDAPWIIEFQGQRYVFDGHHRVATAVHNGRSTIRAHVLHLQG